MKKQLKIIRDMLLIIAAIALAGYLFKLIVTTFSGLVIFLSILTVLALYGLYLNVSDWHTKPEDNDKQ